MDIDSKITKSVGHLTGRIAPSNNKQTLLQKVQRLVIDNFRLLMEYDLSFKKKNQSIDYFLFRIKKNKRLKEYYVGKVYMFQQVTKVFPLKHQHLPFRHQHLPFKRQHLPVQTPTLAVCTPTLAVQTPTRNILLEAFPFRHQHFPVKTPTLAENNKKVLVNKREIDF